MDTEFKVPSIESKVKFVPRKSKEPESDVSSADNEAKKDDPMPNVKPIVRTPTAKTSANCPYKEPKWSMCPDQTHSYSFEVLKSGQIVDNVRDLQSRAFWSMGKLLDNNIIMAHPTISRYHAILQYRPSVATGNTSSDSDSDDETDKATDEKPKVEQGWYLYDLGSTHGSFVNKMRVPPKTYIRIRVGYMLKFGASTRNYILQGPNFDEDAQSELTITEMKELRRQKVEELANKAAEEAKRKEAEGVSWGMTDDADEETDLSFNPFATTNNEELYLQDPKKTLRGFFEREGFELEYKVDEMAAGSYICRVELPITDAFGRNIIAEFSHKGKKKDCVAQCALEGCRILDRHGVLRQANHEPLRKRKAKQSSDDDDDDEFYDRTTEAEQKRKRKSAKEEETVYSYEQLLEEETKILQTIADVEENISKYQERDRQAKQQQQQTDDDDDLDDFMSHLSKEKALDKTEIKKLRFELQQLKTDLAKTKKMINIARPVELPPLQMNVSGESTASDNDGKKKAALPLFGKKRTFGFGKPTPPLPKVIKVAEKTQEENVEEFDDDDAGASRPNESTSESTTATDASRPQTSSANNKTTAVNKNEELTSHQNNRKTSNVADKSLEESVANTSEKLDEVRDTDEITAVAATTTTSSSSKRKRNRIRPRSDKNRGQIDVDDQEEPQEADKYAKWVPPRNQSGDGITDLNAKFGY